MPEQVLCPYCRKIFRSDPQVLCDNNCMTLFCLFCSGACVVTDGRLTAGHDIDCGNDSINFSD